MNKFFNVFLLNLILLSGKHHFEARTLGPVELEKIRFNVEPDTKETENFQNLDSKNSITHSQNANQQYNDYYSQVERLPPNLQTDSTEDFQNYNLQKAKCPFNKEIGLMKVPLEWSDNWYNDCMKKVENKWKTYQSRRRRGRIAKKNSFGPFIHSRVNSLANYLDYTNSQMPFNEGIMRSRKAQNNIRKTIARQIPGGAWKNAGKNSLAELFIDSVAEPKRFERSVRRRFEVPLKSQENIFETPRDDSILGYSRVRRFLDHERAKKRKRMPGTLEAKEAAMSRILDPNLNLDGILEPHVRKRRGQHSKKRDLSFNLLYKKN